MSLTMKSSAGATIYGVDMFSQIALFYMVWMPVGATLSLDRAAGRETGEPTAIARLGIRVIQWRGTGSVGRTVWAKLGSCCACSRTADNVGIAPSAAVAFAPAGSQVKRVGTVTERIHDHVRGEHG